MHVPGEMVPQQPTKGEMAFFGWAQTVLGELTDSDEIGEVAHCWALSHAGVTCKEWVEIECIDEDPRFARYQEGTRLFWIRILSECLQQMTASIANTGVKR